MGRPRLPRSGLAGNSPFRTLTVLLLAGETVFGSSLTKAIQSDELRVLFFLIIPTKNKIFFTAYDRRRFRNGRRVLARLNHLLSCLRGHGAHTFHHRKCEHRFGDLRKPASWFGHLRFSRINSTGLYCSVASLCICSVYNSGFNCSLNCWRRPWSSRWRSRLLGWLLCHRSLINSWYLKSLLINFRQQMNS